MDRTDPRKLQALRTECGCRAGGWAVLLSLAGCAVWAGVDPGSRRWPSWLVTVGGVALTAAVAGKLLGIFWARYRYWRLTRRIHAVP